MLYKQSPSSFESFSAEESSISDCLLGSRLASVVWHTDIGRVIASRAAGCNRNTRLWRIATRRNIERERGGSDRGGWYGWCKSDQEFAVSDETFAG
jgi:hypothetical protein